MEEVDRLGVAAVLAADPKLEFGLGGPPFLDAHGHQLPHAGLID